MKRAVFLDRDDTIIRNVPYLGDPSKVEILAGVREGIQKLREAGFILLVVSNQSGVGRGLISREQVDLVNQAMEEQLGGRFFEKYYMCFEVPGQPGSDKRKPSPHMLFEARDEWGIDLTSSFMVGDRLSDVESGQNAGCKAVLVLTGSEENDGELEAARGKADWVAEDFSGVTEWVLASALSDKGAMEES